VSKRALHPGDYPVLKGDRVRDSRGEWIAMAGADNWLLVRRKGCSPRAMHISEWRQLLAMNGPPESWK
jgi:hypothetical protein